ncbi:MAG: bifunctional DNA-formamidopyrimidine glycosylase/DNA-(apurinic or apyrimidinic site) lyase [Patescibacteria group bacterium]|nr:bifunctional DNA-formamidopyrimidine glycosylase/DNA-(apurinic or apyrimidinic site) lyase [Patescibacteria group bacterium]
MPELPEIETVKLGLQKYLVGHKIEDIEARIPKMFAGRKEDIIGAKITNIKRIGKGLIIEFDNDYLLAVHFKMTGQLIFRNKNTQNLVLSKKVGGDILPSKYSHIIFTLDKGAMLYYNDLRRFGWVKVLKKDELMQMPFFKEMGPEPKVGDDLAGKELTFDYFKSVLLKSNLPIKVILMDQKKIGGIGNIYANDALFLAGIDPRRSAKQITEKEAKKLYEAIFTVINKSLEYGGSSDENFVNALGQDGAYQNHTLVYGKKGKKCPKCHSTLRDKPSGSDSKSGSIIQKIQLGGRGTFFCSKCQK